MKVIIEELKENNKEYVLFHVKEVDKKVTTAIQYIENMDTYLVGKVKEKLVKVNYKDIYYIETVDKKSFLYTRDNVVALSEKLYQLEEKLKFVDFVRVSKSMILNIDKIEEVYPTLSGRFGAKLLNEEKIFISRNYVKNLKNKLGIGGDE